MTTSTASAQNDLLLEVRDLKMHFPIVKGIFGGAKGYVRAVDEVSFLRQSWRNIGHCGQDWLWQDDGRAHNQVACHFVDELQLRGAMLG